MLRSFAAAAQAGYSAEAPSNIPAVPISVPTEKEVGKEVVDCVEPTQEDSGLPDSQIVRKGEGEAEVHARKDQIDEVSSVKQRGMTPTASRFIG